MCFGGDKYQALDAIQISYDFTAEEILATNQEQRNTE